jgi:hypothetical protein
MHHLLFYTSSGTFTVPASVTWVKVTLMGGGGGGASVSSCPSSGFGGGSGGYCESYVSVTPGANISYTVGGGGGAATAGGSSTFVAGTTPTANGGAGGTTTSFGAGGTTSGCSVGITGYIGQNNYFSSIGVVGFDGGSSPKGWGKGGTFMVAQFTSIFGSSGNAAQGYGGGGGGATCQQNATSPPYTGGAGTPGFVQIEY